MRRSGVRIPLAPPQADIRSGCRFFVCLGALVWCLLLCCSWRRWCSGRRRARPLYVPVGGGPPARSPHASLRLGVVDLEARPGPAATHRHRGQAIRRPPHRRQLVSRSQARHSRRPRAPQPDHAATHGHRGRALRSLRRPPHQWRSRNSRLSLLLAAPLVFQVPSGPAAREARASLRSAPRLEARPCPPGPPAPYTPAAPGR